MSQLKGGDEIWVGKWSQRREGGETVARLREKQDAVRKKRSGYSSIV